MSAEALLNNERHYSYADYLSWDDGYRYELINGKAFMMSSPNEAHQRISGNVFGELYMNLKGKTCVAFTAPFDVRLNAACGDDTVVQPDVFVVCDKTKLDGKSCVGAPDLVIEVLSPSTMGMDKLKKFNAYLEAGVREYWIIDPNDRVVTTFVLDNGRYVANMYGDTAVVPVTALEGCEINMADVYAGV